MSPIKTSELTSDSSLTASTDYVVFVDTLDTSQAATGTTKKTPISAIDSYVWANSANHGLQLVSPLNTLVNSNSANWNTALTQSNILASSSANNASNYSNTNSNSANWQSNYSRVNSTSANWSSVYSNVNSTSANWSSVYSNTNTNSANWNTAFTQSNILASSSANNASNYSRVNTTSANWSSVYSNVNSTSANWNTAFTQSNILASSSANNASNYSRVNTTSANWSSVYSRVNASSASWGSGGTDMTGVWSNSANWQSNYSTVNANSASWAGGGGTLTPTSLAYGASITPDCNDGLYRKVEMSGSCTLNPPTNGVEGTRWKGKFTATGGNQDLIFDAAIKIPSETAFAGTKTITSGASYITQLEYTGTEWWLQTLIGGWS